MPSTIYCTICKRSKPATASYFQKGSSKRGFRLPCKLCISARRATKYTPKKLEEKEETKPSEPMPITIYEEPNTDAFRTVIDALYRKHNRFFTFQISKDKAMISFHGSPTLTIKGNLDDCVRKALS